MKEEAPRFLFVVKAAQNNWAQQNNYKESYI